MKKVFFIIALGSSFGCMADYKAFEKAVAAIDLEACKKEAELAKLHLLTKQEQQNLLRSLNRRLALSYASLGLLSVGSVLFSSKLFRKPAGCEHTLYHLVRDNKMVASCMRGTFHNDYPDWEILNEDWYSGSFTVRERAKTNWLGFSLSSLIGIGSSCLWLMPTIIKVRQIKALVTHLPVK